ncbi:MAG: hypothetical protein RML95_00920 [Anaerolineae bacterium]|nr:hypothetical protein [Anaerolineae bacterium]MDW8297875.1 hypothetical protein [Anaerolineae bacterium]
MKDLVALRLLRAVIWHIQSERSPIYRAAWRPSRLRIPFGLIYLLLLLSFPLLRLLEMSSGVPFFIYRDQALISVGLVSAALISLLPYGTLTALTASGLSRLRLAQTWDMFLLTPAESHEVLTAVTAASIRPQWRAILGGLLLSALSSIGTAVVAALSLAANGAWLWATLLIVLCMPLMYARIQEVALSLLVGRRLSYVAPRSAFVLGMMSGIAVRLAVAVLALLLSGAAEGMAALSAEIVRLADILPSNAMLVGSALAISMALLMGEFALIALAPNLLSLLVALTIFGIRSALVRQLAQRTESA